MHSHTFLRAGLIALTLALCALFASAVPVPSASLTCADTHPQSCIVTKPKPNFALAEHSEGIANVIVKRSSTVHAEHLALREDIDQVTLVRRKSIFTKIKEGFKKLGKKIKSGFQKFGKKVKTGFQKFGKKVKTGFQKAGKAIKTGFKASISADKNKAGKAIKTGFQKAGKAIKKVAKKVGNGIKTAAKKVGHFVKTTGAKVAKFGLKVLSTVESIGAKVAGFIPGIGKPISTALKAVSTGTNAASNAIHVDLGKKLDKGMKVLDKIRNPVSGAAGAALNAVLKRDFDDSELEEVVSRDWDSEDSFLEMREDYLEERGEWDEFEERDEEPYELEARDGSHEWEARGWNE
ncbi:hypothetical protein BDQ17DRAFT_1544896 [Cyathus striatus]|nr:hypothetical protein BDQ17DRAFT_1544896 [Cyathus striatus]